MMMKWMTVIAGAFLIFNSGCADLEKDTKPVVGSIQKTSDTLLKERTFGSEDKTQAVLFPRDEEQEKSQFKIKF